MKRYMAAAIVVVVAVIAAPAAAVARQPTYIASITEGQNPNGSWPALYKPSVLPFAQDGTLYVTGIHWVGWNSPRATGYGLAHQRGCIPNCAQGLTRVFPTSIVANRRTNLGGAHVYKGLWIHVSGRRTINWAVQLTSIS